MRFTGLIKGDVSEAKIAAQLHFHGATHDRVTVTKRPESRHGTETHFAVKGDESLESALHKWFQQPGKAPFPWGTLLHFSYRNEPEMTTEGSVEIVETTITRTYTYDEFVKMTSESDPAGPDEGC
jgi:hypothetical protein